MKEPRPGTRKVNGKLLRKLREDRGWHVRDLAEKSGYSERNIERMEAGRPAKFETIRDVAQALGDGVSFETLLDSSELSKALQEHRIEAVEIKPADNAPFDLAVSPNGRVTIAVIVGEKSEIQIDMPIARMNAILSHLIQNENDINIRKVTKGSIIIELELSEEDLLRLVAAFTDTRLDSIDVEAIRLPATTGPLAAGLLQIIQPSGTPTAEMTNPVTPEMTLTRTPTKAITFSVEEAKPNQTRGMFARRWRPIFIMLSAATLSSFTLYGIVYMSYKYKIINQKAFDFIWNPAAFIILFFIEILFVSNDMMAKELQRLRSIMRK